MYSSRGWSRETTHAVRVELYSDEEGSCTRSVEHDGHICPILRDAFTIDGVAIRVEDVTPGCESKVVTIEVSSRDILVDCEGIAPC